MPRKSRQAKTRHEPMTVTGGHLLWNEPPWLDLENEVALREAWSDYPPRAEWITKHPGCRPLAWWAFDAPEPRILEDPTPVESSWLLTNYRRDPHHGESIYEREVDYLRRHGLLIGDEFKRFEVMRLAYEQRQEELTTPAQKAWIAEKRIQYADDDFGSGWRFTSRSGGLGASKHFQASSMSTTAAQQDLKTEFTK